MNFFLVLVMTVTFIIIPKYDLSLFDSKEYLLTTSNDTGGQFGTKQVNKDMDLEVFCSGFLPVNMAVKIKWGFIYLVSCLTLLDHNLLGMDLIVWCKFFYGHQFLTDLVSLVFSLAVVNHFWAPTSDSKMSEELNTVKVLEHTVINGHKTYEADLSGKL